MKSWERKLHQLGTAQECLKPSLDNYIPQTQIQRPFAWLPGHAAPFPLDAYWNYDFIMSDIFT